MTRDKAARRRSAIAALPKALQKRGGSGQFVVSWNAFLNRRKQAMDKTSQTAWITEGIKEMFGFDGRDGQIEAIRTLLFDKRDTVLIAATSYGKSLIPQMVSVLDNKSITIMIVPLTAVGLDQFNMMQTLPNAKPILLCKGKVSKTALEDIRKGDVYSHPLEP